MKKTIQVDVGGRRGYKTRTGIRNKDFVSLMKEYTIDEDGVSFLMETYLDNSAVVKISFASDNVYRVSMFPFGNTEVRQNPVFDFPAYREFKVWEDETFVCMGTSRLKLSIRKCPWEIAAELDGKPLTREHIGDFNVDLKYKAMPLGFEFDPDTKEVRNTYDTYYMYTDEGFYGFGEKFTEFNKRGQIVEVWQRDALSTNSDLSYKGMPYFVSSTGYSVLVNTFTKTKFDMGATSEVSYSMFTEDPYIDYYVFCNRDLKGLIRDYTGLSGRSPMIPKWSLGFWMSKMSYQNRGEVEEVVKRAAEFGMSMDVVHIDGRWQRAWFHSDSDILEFGEDRFPNPEEMLAELKEKGVHVSLWMYPYVSKKLWRPNGNDNGVSAAFTKLDELGYLVKDESGKTLEFVPAEGEGDGGGSYVAAIDFTNPGAVEYVKDKIRKLMKMGVGVIKTDFGEEIPRRAVFYDGSTGKESHNKYPLLYAKTIYEGAREGKEGSGEPALLWGRSGYAGCQNYPANWAGDSSTHQNNLAAILRGGLSMGISGVSFWGFDIGGFYNCDYEGNRSKPSDEEYIRSVQMGLLSPLSRSHGQETPREPWNYSEEAQAAFLKMNKFRYRLFPYLYSLAYESHLEGIPMMRAMLLEFQEDLNVREISTQYMLGDALLVAPVFDCQVQHVYLPRGNWVDFNTGSRVEGGGWMAENCALDTLPLYFREDTIMPMLNHADMHSPAKFFEDYTLYVNLVRRIEKKMYDDGRTYTFQAVYSDSKVSISTDMECSRFALSVPEPLDEVTVNGKVCSIKYEDHYYIAVL